MEKNLHNPGLRLTVSGTVFLVETRAWKVRLEPVPHEEGRFTAFSSTEKQCPACKAKFKRRTVTHCSRCQVELEPDTYLLDVRKVDGKRFCPCKDWSCRGRGEQGDGSQQWCRHMSAAMVLFGFLRSEMT